MQSCGIKWSFDAMTALIKLKMTGHKFWPSCVSKPAGAEVFFSGINSRLL